MPSSNQINSIKKEVLALS